jgi:APA family basic amino acid/polyamine antiporter
MVGSGVFLLPAALGAYGGVSLLGWLLTSLGAAVCALTFARLAHRMPRAGGPYAYTRAAFGEFPAFLVAWGYWLSICAGNAAIAVAMVGYLGFFAPALAASPVLAALTALAAIWLLTAVNARSVRDAGGLQLVTTILKLLPLLAVGTLGLAFAHWENFAPFNVSGRSTLGAVSATAALTLWAFLGLESATIPANEIERPERTIPRATLLGTAAAAVVYILGTVGVMGVMPPAALAHSTAPFADAAGLMWGPWAAYVVAAGTVIACFGALNGWILLQGQLPLAAAVDGLLPGVFRRVSRRGTPVAGLLISSALVTVFVGANYTRGLVAEFTFVILVSTLATLVPYLFSSLALVRWEAVSRQPSAVNAAAGRWRAGVVLVPLLAFGYSLWAVVGTGGETILWGLALFAAGVPAYVWLRRRSPRR